ncbi:hypothetical protein OOU_Y34scaffold00450g1 [Pyricularia oryzae Y34]|uniref:Uncharacterized protein n=1 Tax=Pyricularia oryzae (strain Y34) TaxID=1143189 RepID=A0AA97PMR2_PYRO3|nr:hypothetical protein OOU_Y34scaffold00450g1 [Pyricularia oryzae Y34]
MQVSGIEASLYIPKETLFAKRKIEFNINVY